MISSSSLEERQRFRMARMAVGAFFFLNGVMTTALSARLPAVQTKLVLPPGQLGLALWGCTVGGLVAMNIAARLSRRFGSKIITITATACMGIALLPIAFASTFPMLILALVFFGAASGAMEIAMNIQGADVERAYGRPIFNSFHACFSVGSLMSALLGSTLAAFNVSPVPHFLALTIAACAGIVWSSRFLLPLEPVTAVPGDQTRKARPLHFSRTLILLGVVAFCTLLSVGAMFDWSAVYLSGTLHTGAGLAAAGFATFLVCMTLGRGVGDRMATRFGEARLMRSACLLAAIGLALALLFAWTPVAFFGLGLAGIGLSVPFPLVLSMTGRLSKQDVGSALATVSTWGYCGLLVGPPVIGFVADRVGLRLALALVVSLCVLAALSKNGDDE
jgi:MFS family permease